MRLAAHFGRWLQVNGRGRNERRWQVDPRLIYGQVKKSYRRRRLVRVTRVMRLGTQDALKFFHRAAIESCLGHGAARVWAREALALNRHFSLLWTPVARRLAR